MRTLAPLALLVGFAGAVSVAACGSDSSSSSSGSGGSGGSATSCETSITDVMNFAPNPGGAYVGTIAPNIDGAEADMLGFLPVGAGNPMGPEIGKVTLAPVANAADCGVSTACVFLQAEAEQMPAGAIYLAKSGTVDVTAFAQPKSLTGSFADLTFEKVTIDPETNEITYDSAAGCVHLASFAFDVKPPVEGWTCNFAWYDETKQGAAEIFCDCNCGAPDPDCANPANKVEGCAPGQTCSAMGTCEGVAEGWTCAPSDYAGGKGNGCDCNCGVADPDCKLMPAEPVQGCGANEACNATGVCVPAAWKCPAEYYDENEPGVTADVCDCGCGVKDPDCEDAKATSCNYCDDMGSCSTKSCDMGAPIDPNDNSKCVN